MQRFALTLVQGARGSGKSTLLDAALAGAAGRRVARLALSRRADLGVELARFAGTALDHVVAELGGHLQPEALADVGMALSPQRSPRRSVAERIRVVTAIDGTRFLFDLTSQAPSDDLPSGDLPSDERWSHGLPSDDPSLGASRQHSYLAVVLVEQAEASDVLVVTKADLLSSEALRVVLAVLAELNPGAMLGVARQGRVHGIDLLGPLDTALERMRPSKPTDVLDTAARERAALGVSSYVYRARRPFHPARLREHLLRGWPGVIRSRGAFWLATRMAEAGAWSQVGPLWQTSRGGFWWSALEEQGWPIPADVEGAVRAEWREPFGDRRQELTLIGFELDTRALRTGFDACLLTDEELAAGADAWGQLGDPFPDWNPACVQRRERSGPSATDSPTPASVLPRAGG